MTLMHHHHHLLLLLYLLLLLHRVVYLYLYSLLPSLDLVVSLCSEESAGVDGAAAAACEDDHPSAVFHVRQGDWEQVGKLPGPARGGLLRRRSAGRSPYVVSLMRKMHNMERRHKRERNEEVVFDQSRSSSQRSSCTCAYAHRQNSRKCRRHQCLTYYSICTCYMCA